MSRKFSRCRLATASVLATLAALGFAGTANADTVPLSDPSITQETDHLLFDVSLKEFESARSADLDGENLDWTSNGCSVPGSPPGRNHPGGFDFLAPCQRHDFGYRNYSYQGRLTEDDRSRIDSNFKDDMDSVCNKYKGLLAFRGVECRQYAHDYFLAVRGFG